MWLGNRSYVTAGVAALGAGIVAVIPATATAPGVAVPNVGLTAGEDIAQEAAQDIVIDIVRHGERQAPFNELLVGSPPYPAAPLSELGQQQADEVAQQLFDDLGPHVAGIFSGQGIRDIDTAAPFAELEHMSDQVQILPGLDEIGGGIYSHDPLTSLGGLLYSATMGAWAFGFEFVPLPGDVNPNGVAFNEKFTDAINTMYDYAIDNPVVSDNGEITAVGFNNESSIIVWALTHVKNPDLSFIVRRGIDMITSPEPNEHAFLPNAGIVEIKGNPEDGWTLVSWAGEPIPQDPDLATSLFVDFRDLILAPQKASYDIFEAILAGDPTTIQDAIQTGVQDVGAAIIQFPQAVFTDIADALLPDTVGIASVF
ncbi:PE-PGRS family protein PE_PGRS11 [Mycobacterium tuberculosis H37Rv] [Mycobacterium shimoidei]|uniref:PE-PGRS family protein PE_PGRS11 [Mycobacterium tuberculosis H37Rv] n=1 Tax=Mycobacterium shimoidei TaxID=29313 RepID=A0A375Z3K8_MYCSH|nr:histidine phosphatase family protein [Mycobacterium shimoidei]SRX95741.1 PE-PGRS family protein PE_PGRS11 [Mycobacterium tuberculosis H37Rv] [Mycobacterium shimoidei]